MTLAHTAFRGAAWMIAASVGSRAISLAATLLLTHFLLPHEIGPVANAFIVVMTASFFSQVGFAQYIVTRRGDDREAIFHVTVLHNGLGLVAMGAVLALAGPLGGYLKIPALSSFVPGLVAAFLLDRLATVPQRILIRDLRFRLASLIQSAAEIVYAATSIALAAAGLGGEAIVWANVARYGLAAVVYLAVVGRREWLEPCRLRLERMKEILRFGGPLWIGGVAHMAARRWDNLLFGFLFGPGPVGLYNQAYNLADVPATVVGEQIGDVLLPSYARMSVEERKDALVQFTALVALVVFPLAVGLGAVAPSLVVLLGDEWAGVAPMLTILSALSISRPVGWTIINYLAARGRTQALMTLEVVNVAVLLPSIVVLGRLGGPLWACGGAGISFACMGLLGIWMVKRLDDVAMSRLLLGMVPPFFATVPLALAVIGVRHLFADRSPVLSLVCELLAGVLVYIPSALLIAPRTSRDFLRMYREAILRR